MRCPTPLLPAICAALMLCACASLQPALPEVRTQLAPHGKIRAAINLGNPVLAKRDAASGELRGAAVDLARALGRSSGVAVQLVSYESAASLMAALKHDEWDVAFAAVDPARDTLAFTAPYMEVEVTYLVHEGSPMRRVSDVDGAGRRIAVQARNAADLHLTRELRHASLVRTATGSAAFEALRAGSADALAENRQSLASIVEQHSGYRIVEGRFATIEHAMAVPASNAAAARYLDAFVAKAKRDGLVAEAIERAGLRGVAVAP